MGILFVVGVIIAIVVVLVKKFIPAQGNYGNKGIFISLESLFLLSLVILNIP
jgi:hypothetical protein